MCDKDYVYNNRELVDYYFKFDDDDLRQDATEIDFIKFHISKNGKKVLWGYTSHSKGNIINITCEVVNPNEVMLQNNLPSAPKTLELHNFVINPISTINPCPNEYLFYREEYEIEEAMRKCGKEVECYPRERKLIPKNFMLNKEDEKLFRRQTEEKSIIVTRITSYQLNICNLIDELWQLSRESPVPNEQIDFYRQKKLFTEFIARFSRNYVYELERNIDEIRFYQIDHYSYFERSTNHLISKVCSLFAIITRALQVYQKHLTNLGNGHPYKLLQLMELVMSGIHLCIEKKIFDEEDSLIKKLREKTDQFIMAIGQCKEAPPENRLKKLNSMIFTSRTMDISIPKNPRYIMYDSKAKKVKQSKSIITITKTSRSSNNGSTNRSCESGYSPWRQNVGDFVKMFEMQGSLICSGSSSDYDSYKGAITRKNIDNDMEALQEFKIQNISAPMNFDENPVNVQQTLSELNIGCSSFNNTCNTDGTLKCINNPVVSQCGNNTSNNKKNTERNTMAANNDAKNILYRREVSSASSINTDNDNKIMTTLRRTGCLTLPQTMRIPNGHNECGDVNRRSQVTEKKITFSKNVHHTYIKCGDIKDDSAKHDEEIATKPDDVLTNTNVRLEESNSVLKSIFATTENVIHKTRKDLMAVNNISITEFVKDFLKAEFYTYT